MGMRKSSYSYPSSNGTFINGSFNGSSNNAPYVEQLTSREWEDYVNQQNFAFTQGLQESAQQYNSAEAQKDRDFQENLSNTAYQRAVADLKAAGLNPLLATGAQASTPVGAAASSGIGANSGTSSSESLMKFMVKQLSGVATSALKLIK